MKRQTPAEFLRGIMAVVKGDDLERARLEYFHLSAAEMDAPWGFGQKTPRQILKEYEDERADWLAANDLLERMLAKEGQS